MPGSSYTADSGEVHPIRLAAATITAGGFTDVAITTEIQAKVSKSNREFGLRPRGVRLSRNIGTPEIQNLRYKFLPVATEALYDSAAFAKEAEVTIGGVAWEVVSKEPEDY